VNAAARVTLNMLINEGRLGRVTVDSTTVTQMQEHAGKHVQTAQMGLGIGDNEGCFLLSYDACRKLCAALLFAMGFRVTGEGHHATTFEAAAVIAESFGQQSIVSNAGDLRWVRNSNEYRGENVSPDEAQEALDIANELLVALEEPIGKILVALP
jgi:hypothetical protein